MHFARPKIKRDPFEGVYAGKRLFDRRNFQEGAHSVCTLRSTSRYRALRSLYQARTSRDCYRRAAVADQESGFTGSEPRAKTPIRTWQNTTHDWESGHPLKREMKSMIHKIWQGNELRQASKWFPRRSWTWHGACPKSLCQAGGCESQTPATPYISPHYPITWARGMADRESSRTPCQHIFLFRA